jgi:hypothetical protein
MILSRSDQRALNAHCIRQHLVGLLFSGRGYLRACVPDSVRWYLRTYVLDCRLVGFFVCALIGILALYTLTGCARNDEEMLTGQTVTAAQASAYIPGAKLDTSYAVVREAWLLSAINEWRGWYFSEVGGYDAKSDCEDFSLDFIAWAKRRYKSDTWHSYISGQGPAIGLYCYQPTRTTAHAIVAAITEDGLTLVDPQTGKGVKAPKPFFTVM